MKVAICGPVGSGKSSILSCILGKMTKISGEVKVRGRTAYVSQSPWIQSATIQENILFAKAMDEIRYKEVIKACALGDQTHMRESAVDADTGTHLFKECIQGILRSKTILYVTHQVGFLPPADLILVM
ncbi:hypothetical protein SUGI_0981760 [Cryptomeria japonica]|nr:hypothetical protein SUGI_0981760 [Cryptomeria japonica]